MKDRRNKLLSLSPPLDWGRAFELLKRCAGQLWPPNLFDGLLRVCMIVCVCVCVCGGGGSAVMMMCLVGV